MPNNYILKSDIIENSLIELRRKVLPVPSNQIKVTFIISLPFNLVHLWFLSVSHGNWRKRWVDYLGGPKGMLAPSQILGGTCPPPPACPPLPPLFLRLWNITIMLQKYDWNQKAFYDMIKTYTSREFSNFCVDSDLYIDKKIWYVVKNIAYFRWISWKSFSLSIFYFKFRYIYTLTQYI